MWVLSPVSPLAGSLRPFSRPFPGSLPSCLFRPSRGFCGPSGASRGVFLCASRGALRGWEEQFRYTQFSAKLFLMTNVKVCAIWAQDYNGVIAVDGRIPWRVKSDMAFFRQTTVGCAVVMGRKTFETLDKPLSDRLNIVLTRDPNWVPAEGVEGLSNVVRISTPEEALSVAGAYGKDLYVIGGRDTYIAFEPYTDEIVVSEIPTEIDESQYESVMYSPETMATSPDWVSTPIGYEYMDLNTWCNNETDFSEGPWDIIEGSPIWNLYIYKRSH